MVMLLLVTALYEHAWNVLCAFHHRHGLNIRLKKKKKKKKKKVYSLACMSNTLYSRNMYYIKGGEATIYY